MLLRNKQLRDGNARNVQKELFPSTVVLPFSATTHNHWIPWLYYLTWYYTTRAGEAYHAHSGMKVSKTPYF